MASTITAMVPAAVVWHYWIGVVLFLAALLTVVAVIIGYLVKVQSLKYPKR
jgi:hypothetical protein